jgi:TP901 family phage tail tape measure protein
MADVNANIGINIDTSQSLAEIKNLQRQLAQLYTSINRGSAAAAAAQKGLATNLMNTVNAGGKFYAQMGTIRTSTESFTHALEKNKLTMREYFRFAGGSTRTFGRLFKSEFDTIGKVAEERVKRMQTQYIKLGRDASGAMRAISVTPTSLNMKEYGNQVAVAAQKQAILNQLLKQGSTNLLNFGKNTQWAGRQLMVGFTIPLAYFGTAAAKTFMDLEAQALKFRRVYGDMFTTTAETNKALADIEALAAQFTKYGVAVSKTMEMAASAAAMGRTGAELTAQVAQATRLAVLGNVEQEQALTTTISLTDAFGLAAEDLAGKINFLNSVENQTITAIEDLTIAIPKAGPVVKQLGGSVEDLAFFLTAMREGGINASEGANALKSGLASLINPTEKAAAMLADMGINIKAIVEGNVGNLRQTVIDFSRALDTLAPLERSRAIEQLFGKFQFARLSTLFENVTKDGGQAARVLDLAGKSVEELAILSERELGAIEDAIGTNFRESVEQLKLAIAPIGKEFLKAITPVVKFLGDLFEKFNNLSDGSKKFIVILTTLVGLVGPTLLMTFGLVANGAANIIKLFLLMRQGFLKLTGNSTNLAQQTQYLNSEQMEAAVVAASLNQAHTKLTQQFTLEAGAVNQLRNAYVQATAAAARFAAANPGMMIPGAGKIPKKFNSGTMKVPGYSKGTDSVPAMLTPGEAVIPEPIAQDDRFKPLIAALVSGEIRRYQDGTVFAHAVDKRVVRGLNVPQNMRSLGFGSANAFTAIGFDLSPSTNSKLINNAVPVQNYISELSNPGSVKTMTARLIDLGVPPSEAAKVTSQIRTNLLRSLAEIPQGTLIGDKDIYSRMGNLKTGILGGLVRDSRGGSMGSAVRSLYSATAFSPLGSSSVKMNATAPIASVIDAVKKTKTSQSAIRALTNLQKVDPNIKLPVRLDASGNITAFERPEVSKKTGQITTTRNIGVLTGDRFKTARLGRGGGRKITPSKGATAQATQILMGRGEVLQTKDGRQTVVTGQTGTAKKPGTVMVGGGPSDKRAVPATKVRSVIPRGYRGVPMFGFGAQDGIGPQPTLAETGGKTAQQIAAQHRVSLSQAKRMIADNEKAMRAQQQNTAATTALTAQKATMGQRLATGAHVFSGLTIAGSFMGGKIGEVSQKLAPFAMILSTIAMMGPGLLKGFGKMKMFFAANPLALVATAAIALVATLKYQNSKAKKAGEAAAELATQQLATADRMKAISLITDKVGATELAARAAQSPASTRFTTGYERGKSQFGTTFLESDFGKQMYETFVKNLKDGGREAAQTIALELGTYISDGVLSAEQAFSIARSIGLNLKDMTVASQIKGELIALIGPDGTDVIENGITIRARIVEASEDNLQTAIENTQDNFKGLDLGGLTYDEEDIKAVGKLAAYQSQYLQNIKSAVAASRKNMNDRIKELEIEKAKAKSAAEVAKINDQINTLKKEQNLEEESLRLKYKDAVDLQVKAYQEATSGLRKYGAVGAAYFAGLDKTVKQKFKGTGNEPVAEEFLKTATGTTSQIFEVKLKALVAGGVFEPKTLTDLVNLFGPEKEDVAQKSLDLALTKKDPEKIAELVATLTGFKNKKLATDILINATSEDGLKGKELENRLEVIGRLRDLNNREVNIEMFIQANGMDALDELYTSLDYIENIKGPITTKVISDLQSTSNDPNMPNMNALLAIWDKYEALPDEVKKTVIQEYVSLFRTVTEGEAEASLRGKGVPDMAITPESIANEQARIASNLVTQAAKYAEGVVPSGSKTGLDKGKGRDTTLDELLKRLKFIRKASIDAQGGVKELLKITGGKGLKNFGGVMQQLMAGPKGGFNREFISFLEGMDNKTRATYMTIKNGEVVLTKQGKALKEAFNEKVIGEYQVANRQALQDTKAQGAALLKLQASGVDSATALEMVADANLAVAINSKDITGKELRQMAKDAKAAKDEVKSLNLEVLRLAEDLKAKVVDAGDALKAVIAARQSGIVDPEMLKRISQDQNLINEIVQNGMSPVAKGIIESYKAMDQLGEMTEGVIDPAKAAMDAFDKLKEAADKVFDRQSRQAQVDFENSMKRIAGTVAKLPAAFANLTIEGAISKANEDIDVLNREIDEIQYKDIRPLDIKIEAAESAIDDIMKGLETQAAGMQRGFNLPSAAYEDVAEGLKDKINEMELDLEFNPQYGARFIEQLQDQISDIELEIELNFSRPIADLQEESSDLSNDLTLMDRITDGINKKYDAQAEALQRVSDVNQEILNQQKSQLDIAGALSQGDIAAAARAAQEARAQSAAAASQRAGGVLDAARQAEISAVRSPGGLTRSQIEERQFQISQQIFQLEEQSEARQRSILVLQDQIRVIEETRTQKQREIRDIQDEIAAGERAREAFIKSNVLPLETQIKDLQAQRKIFVDAIKVKEDEILKIQNEILAPLEIEVAAREKILKDQLAAIDAQKLAYENARIELEKTLVPATEFAKQAGNAEAAFTNAKNKYEEMTKLGPITIRINEIVTRTVIVNTVAGSSPLNTSLVAGKMYGGRVDGYMGGGKVRKAYMAYGGAVGSDTVPAMLTPGEFVVNKASSKAFAPFLTAINESKYPSVLANKISDARPIYQIPIQTSLNQPSYNISTPVFNTSATNMANASYNDNSSAVYNYSVGISVGGTNASPETVAKAVMNEIKYLDSQRVKKQRVS